MAKKEVLDDLDQLRGALQTTDGPTNLEDIVPADLSDQPGLACALCYEPFPADQLTVASRQRFNFEAAVVVCPNCLAKLQQEMKQKSYTTDLVLGLIWGLMGLLGIVVVLGLMIWFNYSWPQRELWLWLGNYLAFLPGLVIGRAIFYGVGRRHSLKQQLLALALTLCSILLLGYVAQVAAINFQMDIMYKNGHPVQFMDPMSFFFEQYLGPLINGNLSKWVLAGAIFGPLFGLVVAYFASAGPQLHLRPYTLPKPTTPTAL